jgi:hypothetical protein
LTFGVMTAEKVTAQVTTWEWSGTVRRVDDTPGVLSSAGVRISPGDPFQIVWTYDPNINPTVVTPEVAQWHSETTRSSMTITIGAYRWVSIFNFNDQVFDNGTDENVASQFRTDVCCSAIVTPLNTSFVPAITATSWVVHATDRDTLDSLSWPPIIDLAQWDSGEMEIFEEGKTIDGQFYTYSVFGDITHWRVVTVDERIASLIASINGLVSDGSVRPGQANGLIRPLQNVCAASRGPISHLHAPRCPTFKWASLGRS